MSLPASAAAPAAGPVLRDIHVPPAPSFWPPAPGWWLAAFLLLMMAALGIWLWRRRSKRLVAENTMLQEVDVLVTRWRAEPQKLAAALHQLLRRAALRYDDSAAQRQGAAWRSTLAMVAVDTPTLDRLMTLDAAMYRPDASFDIDATADAARRWLRLAWRQRADRRNIASGNALPLESTRA